MPMSSTESISAGQSEADSLSSSDSKPREAKPSSPSDVELSSPAAAKSPSPSRKKRGADEARVESSKSNSFWGWVTNRFGLDDLSDDDQEEAAEKSPALGASAATEIAPKSILKQSREDRRRRPKSQNGGIVKILLSTSEDTCISPHIQGRQKFVKPPLPVRRRLIEVAQDLTKVMRAKDGSFSSSESPKQEKSFLETWNPLNKLERQREYAEKLEEIERRMRKIEMDMSKSPAPPPKAPRFFLRPRSKNPMKSIGPRFSKSRIEYPSTRLRFFKGPLKFPPSAQPPPPQFFKGDKNIPIPPLRPPSKVDSPLKSQEGPEMRKESPRAEDNEQDDDDDDFDDDEDSDSESPPL